MSDDSTHRGHSKVTLTNSLSPPRGSMVESSTASRDRDTSTPRPPREPERERGEDTVVAQETRQLRREVEHLRGLVDREGANIAALSEEREKLIRMCRRRDDQIVNLKHEIAGVHGSYQEVVEAQIRQIEAVQGQLKQTEELLETRSAELSGAHAFLSTADRLSETEVLNTVRDLNESIYQVAVGLVEEWEKLDSSQVTTRMDVDPTSRPDVPTLVRLARGRDVMGLTFLLQTCLCFLAVEMTSSWGRHQESAVLGSIYKHLSASGENHIVDSGYATYVSQRGKRSQPDGGH